MWKSTKLNRPNYSNKKRSSPKMVRVQIVNLSDNSDL